MPILTVADKRILYIHVPKTGGTSVEHLLRSYGGSLTLYSPRRAGLPCTPQHFHGAILKELFSLSDAPGGREHYFDFVFMTVRHPIFRLLSEYRHQRTVHQARTAENPAGQQRRFGRKPVAQRLSFDLWARYALFRYARDPFFAGNHLRPQFEYSIWTPEVFRLEDGLKSVQQRLDELIGVSGEMPVEPRRLSTDRAGSAEHLRDGTMRLIRSHFARDFAEYGY